MLKENLYFILRELKTVEQKSKNSRENLYANLVKERLESSTDKYYKQMQDLYESLLKKDNARLIKALSKYFKE